MREASLVLGTTDPKHPLVSEMVRWGKVYVSGELKMINLPIYYDFVDLRRTPAEVRSCLEEMGNANVVAFQTRNPMHRIHEELTKRAAEEVGGSLLIHPVVGMTSPAMWTTTRVCAFTAPWWKTTTIQQRTLLSLFPLAMRMAGPREALWHAIIRRNYGANHLIIGRDHAGPGNDSQGKPFYGPYEAQTMMAQYADEIGVKPVEFKELVYLADEDRYEEVTKVPEGEKVFSISGTQVREDYLAQGQAAARVVHPQRDRRNPAADVPATPQAGRLHLVHRSERLGQIDHGGSPDLAAAGARPPGHRAGRRCGPHAPLQGSGLLAVKTATPTSCASASWPARSPATAAR